MKKIIYFFLLTLTISSCSKDDNPESSCSNNDWENIYISKSLKDFFFKEGSYWIYQNDSTLVLDSVAISFTEQGCEAVYLYQGYGSNWEYYLISYQSYPSYKTYYDMIEGQGMMRNRHPSEYMMYYGWLIYSDTTLIYPWRPIYIDSLQVEGHIFHQVQYQSWLVSLNERIATYTSLGTGIIKKIVYTGSNKGNWNLIRWKIVK